MKNITCLLLSGGHSTRLWPLQDKNLLTFFGKPLIYHSILQLKKAGLINFVIVANDGNIISLNKLKENPQLHEVKIDAVIQKNEKGMAGAILCAREIIKNKKLLIVSPTDVIEDILLSDFSKIIKTNPEAVIAGVTVNEYFPGGYLVIENEKVKKIVEKPESSSVPSSVVNLVFHYYDNSDKLLSALENTISIKDDRYEKTISKLIEQGINITYLPYKGYWGHIKYPWHVLEITSQFLSKITKKIVGNAVISDTAKIEGNVWIDDDVKICDNAKIVGPCYIGKGTVIGDNVLVRQSYIGSKCLFEYSSEIARSYVGDNCRFHHNYVGDSVILDNISMGAQAVTANFRLDEKSVFSTIKNERFDTGKHKLGAVIGENSRIGVNCSIMPGVKVGNNCFVGSGIVLDKDLPDNKFCISKPNNYLIKNNNRI